MYIYTPCFVRFLRARVHPGVAAVSDLPIPRGARAGAGAARYIYVHPSLVSA